MKMAAGRTPDGSLESHNCKGNRGMTPAACAGQKTGYCYADGAARSYLFAAANTFVLPGLLKKISILGRLDNASPSQPTNAIKQCRDEP